MLSRHTIEVDLGDDDSTRSDAENADTNNPYPAPRDPSPPRDRHGFGVAILCALPPEASAITACFDKQWDDQIYGKAPGDSNAYSTGVIGHHNVVLVHIPNMGKVAAAIAAAYLRSSFQGIQLALVVGICGATPIGKEGENIFLGDVVISKGLVQYDLGRRSLNSRFEPKDRLRDYWDNLPRPSPEIRAALTKLQTEQGRNRLQNKTSQYLGILRHKLRGVVTFPGSTEAKLFKSTFLRKHHSPSECMTCSNDDGGETLCAMANGMSCQHPPPNPVVHFGLVASGDTVMRSREDRDNIAARDGVIAFEMEGAGVWETFPHSLVIKGVCDYADSRKDKRWQGYAAVTAAAATKGFLENWSKF